MAHPPSQGLHRLRPQGGAAGAPKHLPAQRPVHGLPAVGGGAPGGRHCVAGGLGPPGDLSLPPGQERPGRGGGDAGPLGAVSPSGMGRRGDEHRLRQVFPSHPPGGRAALALELGMDPGTCRALGAMYKQLRRAFKIAGAFGLWWQATTCILRGCPLSVILVNVITTIWKSEVDSLRRQVCAQTAALSQALDKDAAEDVELGALLPLKDAGPGYAALGSLGYADDTQAVALGAAALQDTFPATEEWLGSTRQDVRVNKSCSWVEGEQGALLRRRCSGGSPSRWRRPSASSASTSPLEVSRPRDGCCPGAWKRGGAPCVTCPNSRPTTGESGPSAPRSPRWGPARVSRANAVVFTVLTKGHRLSVIMHTRYERILWLARLARRPGVTQVLAQAIWDSGAAHRGRARWGARSTRRPPWAGARATAGGVGMSQGRRTPCTSCRSRSASCGTGSGTTFAATPRFSCKRGAPSPLVGGAMGGWPGLPRGAAGGLHGVGEVAAARGRGRGHVDGGHGLGPRHAGQRRVTPLRRGARGRGPRPMGQPRVGRCQRNVAPLAERRGGGLPQPGPAVPVALLPAERGPFPLPAGKGGGPGALERLPLPLVWHVLGVLAARMAASAGDQPGHGDSVFPEQPRPRPRNPYPWDAFVGPIPGDAVCHQPPLQPGVPADRRWPQDFIHDLVRWGRAPAWVPGPAEVSWAELALDYEAFVGRATPASPDHRLRGTRLPLGDLAQVLRKAVGLAERHVAAGALLGGAPVRRCRSLLHPGGRVSAGLSARPYFAAPRGNVAADAPGGALPRPVGLAHAATTQ